MTGVAALEPWNLSALDFPSDRDADEQRLFLLRHALPAPSGLLRASSRGLTSSFLNQPIEVETLRPRLADRIGRSGRQPQLVLPLGYGPDVPRSPREPVENVLADSSADG